MDYVDVEDELPRLAVRCFVVTSTGWVTIGRLIKSGWVDDQSLPIRRVEKWQYIE